MATVVADLDRWNALKSKAQAYHVVSAFKAFRAASIEPLLIKGWAAALKYPLHHQRRPGDVDLAVSPSDHERSLSLIRGSTTPLSGIDLHRGLRTLDTVEWEDLFEHSVLVGLDGTPIRILCEEDHLRVLATHWLMDGGSYRDKLWDIYYAVENRSSDFDWDRCLNVVASHRRRWVTCTIGLAHKYLGLDISDLRFADEAKQIPEWVTKCIEREWARSERLEPILTSTHDTKLLLHQIVRRFPPNPVRATIEGDGDLYEHRRWFYQAGVLVRRSFPFARQLVHFIRVRLLSRKD